MGLKVSMARSFALVLTLRLARTGPMGLTVCLAYFVTTATRVVCPICSSAYGSRTGRPAKVRAFSQ